jgi:DNA-directed RNA polymerase subunit H (RpoH/RPB5)
MSSSASYSPIISKIYKSRNIILDLLKSRGYKTEDYEGFSVNDTHTMFSKNQLDMLLEHKTNGKKLYINYGIYKKLRQSYIDEAIEDLFDVEEILTNEDELIIISKDKINDALRNAMKQSFINDNRFYNIYNLNDYLFNILDHVLVSPHEILTENKKKEIIIQYNITNMSQFPEISRFDPVAQALGMRPTELCEIRRPSPTAITTNYYRYCCH